MIKNEVVRENMKDCGVVENMALHWIEREA